VVVLAWQVVSRPDSSSSSPDQEMLACESQVVAESRDTSVRVGDSACRGCTVDGLQEQLEQSTAHDLVL